MQCEAMEEENTAGDGAIALITTAHYEIIPAFPYLLSNARA